MMIIKPDLALSDQVEVYQLTDLKDIPCCHVYMEAPVFTPDSKQIVLHRAAHPHGPCKDDPNHAYLLCDLDDNGRLHSLTGPEEHACTSPLVSPDGKWFYYFVDHTAETPGKLILKRVGINGTERETLFVLDGTIGETRFRASSPYPLATISADGARIALQVFLQDGYTRNNPFGLLVFDLEKGTYSLPLWGPTLCNMHAQYSRSTDPKHIYDLLIQENHGYISNASGKIFELSNDGYVDLHVIRDDGTNLRDLPIGGCRPRELCSGHQCWRGTSEWAISSVISIYGRGRVEDQDFRLIEALPVSHQGHRGANSWWAERNEISADESDPHFNHFGVDISGTKILTEDRDSVKFARLNEPGQGASRDFIAVADTRMRQHLRYTVDSHPFLSPDGKFGFFNSNESTQLQAYMIKGLDAL